MTSISRTNYGDLYNSVCIYCPTWGEKYRKLFITFMFIAAFCLTATGGGILYSFGNIQPYIVSYIRERSHPSSLRYTQSTYLYSTQFAGFAIGIAIGLFMEIKLKPRMCLIVGGSLMSLGVLLSYFTIQYSYWLLFITFGVMFSIGLGIGYMMPIICVLKWVSQERSGLAVGLSLLGVGLGGLGLAALQTGFVNRNNYFPDKAPYEVNPDEKYFTQVELIERVPYIFIIEGFLCVAVTAFGAVFMAVPFNNAQQADSESSDITPPIKPSNVFSLRKSMRILLTFEFYTQWSVATINVIAFGMISSLYKTYGLEVLKSSDSFLSILGAVANGVLSTIGRVGIGFLADLIGYKLSCALQSALMAVLLLTLPITSLGYPVMYFIWVNGLFLCYGSYGAITVIATGRAFGQKYFNINYTLIVSTSQVIASYLYGIVSDFAVDTLGWLWTFVVIGGLGIIQFMLVLSFGSENNDKEEYAKKYIVDYRKVFLRMGHVCNSI